MIISYLPSALKGFQFSFTKHVEIMDTKDQIEHVVYHQTQCLNAIEDLKKMIQSHHEDLAVNKLKDLKKELTRLTLQLRQIEEGIAV